MGARMIPQPLGAMLRQWEQAIGTDVQDRVMPPPTEEWAEFRQRLLDEELAEAEDAMARLRAVVARRGIFEVTKQARDELTAHAELAKELADAIYILAGTAVLLGYDIDAALAAVHASNMSKVAPGGSIEKRADGKILKGPDYQPPDMWAALFGATGGCYDEWCSCRRYSRGDEPYTCTCRHGRYLHVAARP